MYVNNYNQCSIPIIISQINHFYMKILCVFLVILIHGNSILVQQTFNKIQDFSYTVIPKKRGSYPTNALLVIHNLLYYVFFLNITYRLLLLS